MKKFLWAFAISAGVALVRKMMGRHSEKHA